MQTQPNPFHSHPLYVQQLGRAMRPFARLTGWHHGSLALLLACIFALGLGIGFKLGKAREHKEMSQRIELVIGDWIKNHKK